MTSLAHHQLLLSGAAAPGGAFYQDLIDDAPVAFWRLGEPSGDFSDLGSNNNPLSTASTSGLTRGTASSIPSESSNCVATAGATQIGSVAANIFTIALTQSLTIVMTLNVNPMPAAAAIYGLLHQGNDGNAGQQGLMCYVTDAGAFGIQVFSAGFKTAQTANGLIAGNSTQLLVIVIDQPNSQIRTYIAGALVDTQTWAFGTGAGVASFTFTAGAYVSTTIQAPLKGKMQGLAIFDKVISAGRITQYNTDWL